jgi:uncharacterized protein YdeI (YjbR/CyaY-like superfamily)
MNTPPDELPILTFTSANDLRSWLEQHHAQSKGIWLRIFKRSAGMSSVTFEEVLDEGLIFGWSESLRRSYDDVSYLQRFTPRKTAGTQSKRNLGRARALVKAGRMTPSGLKALGLDGIYQSM